MPNAVVFSTIASARTFAGRPAARMGYPSPGVNARTGEPVQPGAPGWTISEYDPIRVVDVNGAYGPAGTAYFVVGPVSDRIADRIAGMTNPPKIVDVPAALFRKGRRYRQYIQSWLNGLPVSGEIQEDFNETVP